MLFGSEAAWNAARKVHRAHVWILVVQHALSLHPGAGMQHLREGQRGAALDAFRKAIAGLLLASAWT